MSNSKIDSLGNNLWYNADVQLHRIDGPACEWANGDKEWWVNGQCHRLDGPACEWADGDKEWWVNGQLHRLDGPARMWADGSKAWYLYGKRVTEAEHYAQTCVYQFIMSKPYPDTVEPTCSSHPDAPHGFDRNASASLGRYVCDCEGWTPEN